MASLELQRLWKLHQIDSALLEIRNRAASLDPGRAQAAEVKKLQAEMDASPGRILQGELTDFELQQKTLQDKIKKFEGQLYGGKVVNPREVEALQKEVSILKRQRDEFDERIIDLLDKLPEAKKKAEVLE